MIIIKIGDKIVVKTTTSSAIWFETAIVLKIEDDDILVRYIEGFSIGAKEYVDISQCVIVY